MTRSPTAFAMLCLAAIATPVWADQFPKRDQYDSRMRYVPYNEGQVVHLSTQVGATLVVGFSDKETVSAVAETDSVHLASIPKGNYLFFKPGAALTLQPVVVLTSLPDGKQRRYVFEIQTITAASMANGVGGVYYSVQFIYPQEIAEADAAKEAAAARERQAAVVAAEQARAQYLLQKPTLDPNAPGNNWHYVARGDHSLTPIAVFDNGYSTVFRFPQNERIPGIFVINPDGKEATAPYSVSGGYAQVGMTAKEFRLRDGGTVLDVYNLGYGTMGVNPATGTVSTDVQRVVKGATP
jgi:type IV secretion system protein VirB9